VTAIENKEEEPKEKGNLFTKKRISRRKRRDRRYPRARRKFI
jgi:hypothetical protein